MLRTGEVGRRAWARNERHGEEDEDGWELASCPIRPCCCCGLPVPMRIPVRFSRGVSIDRCPALFVTVSLSSARAKALARSPPPPPVVGMGARGGWARMHGVASGKFPLFLSAFYFLVAVFGRDRSRLFKQECSMFCTTTCLSSVFLICFS